MYSIDQFDGYQLLRRTRFGSTSSADWVLLAKDTEEGRALIRQRRNESAWSAPLRRIGYVLLGGGSALVVWWMYSILSGDVPVSSRMGLVAPTALTCLLAALPFVGVLLWGLHLPREDNAGLCTARDAKNYVIAAPLPYGRVDEDNLRQVFDTAVADALHREGRHLTVAQWSVRRCGDWYPRGSRTRATTSHAVADSPGPQVVTTKRS